MNILISAIVVGALCVLLLWCLAFVVWVLFHHDAAAEDGRGIW